MKRSAGGPRRAAAPADGVRHGIARAMSRRGYCSRSQAAELVRAGRVQLNGRAVRDPETPTRSGEYAAARNRSIVCGSRSPAYVARQADAATAMTASTSSAVARRTVQLGSTARC